ncbi:MAG: type 4a pilus biogenesis protein PilO [Candidatus Omnitrophota bacterium]
MNREIKRKDQVLIAGIVIIGIIIGASFLFIFQPLLKQILNYNNEEKAIKAELEKVLNVAKDKEELQAEVKGIEDKIAAYEQKLSQQTDIPQMLDDLIRIGRKSNVEFVSIEPQKLEVITFKTDELKKYLKIPIDITLRAGYHEVAQFANYIENSEQFMKIDDVKISGNREEPLRHSIDLTISAFAKETENNE